MTRARGRWGRDVCFPVTDHLGKPVVTMNSQGELSGVGEYEPYGRMNRADAWDDTGHPYANGASKTMVDQDFKLLGMKLDARATSTNWTRRRRAGAGRGTGWW